jgi:hypothetical protein
MLSELNAIGLSDWMPLIVVVAPIIIQAVVDRLPK